MSVASTLTSKSQDRAFMRSYAKSNPTSSRGVHAARRISTLLLVDDEPMIREVLKTVLALEGYAVVTAEDGPTALGLASRIQISMLITDFHMPLMDGFTLATLMTDRKPALPVLLMSGAPPNEIPLEQLAARNWSYLAKPLQRDKLLKRIDRECLGRAVRPGNL
jgi:DNA-binding NtrC family response regulator